MATFTGTSGDDNLTGTSGDDIFQLYQGGNDTATGLAGNDIFNFGAAFTAADSIDGGTGTDYLRLNGDYSAGVTFGAATMTNVEVVQLSAGFNYNLTTNDATVAAGQSLTVDAHNLGAGNSLTFNGAAESDGHFVIEGGAGNDTTTGGVGADTFNLTYGGNDIANGGGGADTFLMGAALTAADQINGGAGADTVKIDGYYMGGTALVFGPDTLVNVERLDIGNSDPSYCYDITTDDNTVAAGATLTVDGSSLTASQSLTFNGSAETDGHFVIKGGADSDTLTGGALSDTLDLTQGGDDTANGGDGNDTFLMGGALTAADQINGGAGNDTVQLSGDYSGQIVLAATTLENVETLKLIAGNTYNIVTNDANVAPGQTMTVDASGLGIHDSLIFNGNAESNGAFDIIGGQGNDTLQGGNGTGDTFDISEGGNDGVAGGTGNDTILAGGAFTSSDSISGGGGNDTLVLDGDYPDTGIPGSTLRGVETIRYTAGHNYLLIEESQNITGGGTLTIDASGLGAANSAEFTGNKETHGNFVFDGGGGANNFFGGANADTFNMIDTGANTLRGGSGADVFNLTGGISASDVIDGGTGADTVTVGAGVNVVFNATTMTNIAKIVVAPGTGGTDSITTADATIFTGATLIIDATGNVTGDTVTVNGAAETNGHFLFDGGFGTNNFTGGTQSDTFRLDSIGTNNVTGGGGADHFQDSGGVKGTTTYNYNHVSDSTSTGYDTITGLVTSNFVFHVSPIGAVTGIDPTVTSGSLSTATFDSDLSAAIGAGQLAAHHAVEFTATSGTLSGNTFLVIDEDGNPGYQPGGDLVINIGTNHPTLTLAEFS